MECCVKKVMCDAGLSPIPSVWVAFLGLCPSLASSDKQYIQTCTFYIISLCILVKWFPDNGTSSQMLHELSARKKSTPWILNVLVENIIKAVFYPCWTLYSTVLGWFYWFIFTVHPNMYSMFENLFKVGSNDRIRKVQGHSYCVQYSTVFEFQQLSIQSELESQSKVLVWWCEL